MTAIFCHRGAEARRLMTIKEQADLQKLICRILLPLVSPYDLNEHQLKNQFYNNPLFRRAVFAIENLITKEPTTVEKLLNDLAVIKQFDSRIEQ